MNPFELLLLIGAVALPFHLLVMASFEKLIEPKDLRNHGVVILSPTALQARDRPIGTYMGQSIWASVTFKGMLYRFDRVAPPSCAKRVGPRELYLDPGLVYVTD